MKYQLIKNSDILIEAATFKGLWDAVVEHYGHLTVKEFSDKGYMIVTVCVM